MKQLAIVFILVNYLLGCNSTTLPSAPEVQNTPVSLGQSAQTQLLIYVWLPPANQNDFQDYVTAFNNDVKAFSAQRALTNLHEQAQKAFVIAVNEQGGLFNKATGRIDQDKLSVVINATSKTLFSRYKKVQHIAYLVPFSESIQIVDGIGIWQHTKQKSFEHNAGSKKYTQAISVKVNYVARDTGFITSTVGLDMKEADIDDNGRYRHIVEYLFSPFLPVNN